MGDPLHFFRPTNVDYPIFNIDTVGFPSYFSLHSPVDEMLQLRLYIKTCLQHHITFSAQSQGSGFCCQRRYYAGFTKNRWAMLKQLVHLYSEDNLCPRIFSKASSSSQAALMPGMELQTSKIICTLEAIRF